MKEYDYILAIDPSGSYHEGQGTSGWVLGNKFGRVIEHGFITAKNFHSPESFWQAHKILISVMLDHYKDKLVVVIEDFLVYADKAQAQINSRMETCRLLGVLQVHCWEQGLEVHFQRAVDVKSRWSNEILERDNILESHKTYYTLTQDAKKINRHEIDALRHMLHFTTFKMGQNSVPKESDPKLKSFYNYQDRPWEGEKK